MQAQTREQLEARENFVATFEFADKPGYFRCLLEAPTGELFWHDIGKTEGWQWGICALYEGHNYLKDLVTDEFYHLVKGVLPWERKKATKVDEAAVSREAERLIGLVEA